MEPLQIPNLQTLDTLPSWCNLHGHLDRSACVEIRVSELRRLAGCVKIDKHGRDDGTRPLKFTNPLPHETRALKRFGDGSARLSAGVITIQSRHLHFLHETRMPRLLAGDFRTLRAHVMRRAACGFAQQSVSDQRSASHQSKIQNPKSKMRFRCRINRANPIAWPPDRNLPPNPNKGATRRKIIGLPMDWSQPIRIEKWTYPRRIAPVYFLVCPGAHKHEARMSRHEGTQARRHEGKPGRTINHSVPSCHRASVPFPPSPSTRRPGREHPSSKKCPQRCHKLLMVQCTKAEARDADLAQLWIDSLPDRLRLREPYMSFIHQLNRRYGPIFFPRVLLCPRCLGVHYGHNPETIRQGWRRRNHKRDTTVAGNPHALLVPLNHWSRRDYEFDQMRMNEGRTAPKLPKPQWKIDQRRDYQRDWQRRDYPYRRAREAIRESEHAWMLPHLKDKGTVLRLGQSLREARRADKIWWRFRQQKGSKRKEPRMNADE